MKTTTTGHIHQRRAAHHRSLELLQMETCGRRTNSGLNLWRALYKIERKASKAAEDLCNVPDFQDKAEVVFAAARRQVSNLFGGVPRGFFINRDPRGHALKLSAEQCDIPEGMQTDWGQDGILAAEINE